MYDEDYNKAVYLGGSRWAREIEYDGHTYWVDLDDYSWCTPIARKQEETLTPEQLKRLREVFNEWVKEREQADKLIDKIINTKES
jgi:hypothetical protein